MSVLFTSPRPAMDQDVQLLLDADYLSYMIAAISQHKERPPNTEGAELMCIDADADIWVWVDPLPLVHWKIRNEIEKLFIGFASDNIRVFLTTNDGTFRHRLAVSKPYKGQRTAPRPYYYHAVRDYLLSEYGAELSDDEEADDLVAIAQQDGYMEDKRTVIVSPDKDLRNMYGWHFNPRKQELAFVTPMEAAGNFYWQMLLGDKVDNIPGLPGIGPKKAERLWADTDDDWFEDVVVRAYVAKGLDEEYFLEQARLLHMRRRVRETWDFNYDWFFGFDPSTKYGYPSDTEAVKYEVVGSG